jgi:SAM-dependent methyltransferase
MKPIKKLRNKIFALINPGKKVYCVYCGKTYRKFLHEGVKSPVFKKYKVAGGGYKLNVQCPNCYSVDRSRLLYLFFELRTDIYKKPTRVLHISPNKEIANQIAKGKTVTQVVGTIEPEMYMEYDPLRLDVQKMDAIPDGSFDVVICCHVIEHVDDDAKAMKEIYRVLKAGGFAVLQVPLALNLEKTLEDRSLKTDKERKLAFGQVDHNRLYGMDYFEKLKAAGFRVERDNPYTNKWMEEKELIRHRLDPVEDVIVAHRDK